MVLSVYGLPHDEAVNLAKSSFGSFGNNETVYKEPARYTGGEVRAHTASPVDGLSHVALAFETGFLSFFKICLFMYFVCVFCLCIFFWFCFNYLVLF